MSDEVNNGYSSEQEEEVRRFLREKKVRKLLEEVNLYDFYDLNANNYEKDKVFNWENDLEMNPDFALWELELLNKENK